MSSITITKASIADEISRNIGFSYSESQDMVNAIIKIMIKKLATGEDLLLTNFGKFEVKRKNSRIGRNPRTMDPFPINARKVIRFVVSKKLKMSINKTKSKKTA